jgi:hypothetical protein
VPTLKTDPPHRVCSETKRETTRVRTAREMA